VPNLIRDVRQSAAERKRWRTAIANCAAGLFKRLWPSRGCARAVNGCAWSSLNSKVDHRDYQGDHTAFGAAVMDKVGLAAPEAFYMTSTTWQIMEGDVIRTISRSSAMDRALSYRRSAPGGMRSMARKS